MNKRELVCGVCSRFSLCYGSNFLEFKGNETCRELANASVFSRDVGGLGCAYSVEILISAKVVVFALKSGCPSLGGCIVGVYGSACSVELNGELAISVVVNGDVLLFFAYEDVELEAAFNCLCIYVDSLVSLVGSSKVSATYFAGDVEGLAKGNLVQVELVSYACGGSCNVGRNIEILGCSINLNGKYLSVGSFTACNGSSQSEFKLLFTKDDVELAAFYGFVAESPSDGNIIIVLANCVEGERGVFGNSFGNRKDFLFSCNLFCGSLNVFLEVGEGGNAHGNEVGFAVVKNNDTGYVCFPAELFFVSVVYGSLIGAGVSFAILINLEGGGEITYIGTNVSSSAVELEVEVLRCVFGHILSTDFNALNGCGHTNVVSEGFACSKLIGEVERSNFFLVGVNDLYYGAALNFLHAGVGFDGTGNFNSHTNFDLAFRNGILSYAVAVVTALAFEVSQEEVVVLIANRFGVDSNNDTSNNNVFALLSCHIFLKGVQHILRNGEVEGLGCGGAVCCLNGSGQNVGDIFCGFIGYVYNVVKVILLGEGELVGAGKGPSNVIGNGLCGGIVKECNLCSQFKICSGNVLTLVEVEDVICSGIYVVSYLVIATNVIEVILQFFQKITRSEGGYTQCQGQQNY